MATSHLLHSNQEIGPPGQDGKIAVEPLHGGERFVDRGGPVVVEGRKSAEHRGLVPQNMYHDERRKIVENKESSGLFLREIAGNKKSSDFFPNSENALRLLANPSSHSTPFLVLSLSSTNDYFFVSNVAGRGRRNSARRYGNYG